MQLVLVCIMEKSVPTCSYYRNANTPDLLLTCSVLRTDSQLVVSPGLYTLICPERSLTPLSSISIHQSLILSSSCTLLHTHNLALIPRGMLHSKWTSEEYERVLTIKGACCAVTLLQEV